MSETDELAERAKALGMNLGRLKEVLKAGFSEPAYDLMPKHGRDNPNHNLSRPKTNGVWYVKYSDGGVRKTKPLCADLEKARKMRDEFFASINYGKK
jgi:hypothetical protein